MVRLFFMWGDCIMENSDIDNTNNHLLYFYHKQRGWHGAELLLYSSYEEVESDLKQMVDYSVLANRMDADQTKDVLERFDAVLSDDSRYPKFKMGGSYDEWHAEVIPVRYGVDGVTPGSDTRLYVLHRNGLHDSWKVQLFLNLEDGKKRFRQLAEMYIDQELTLGIRSASDAKVQRITLDEYLRMGQYKWGFLKDQKYYGFDLQSYKVKDLRLGKDQYLDGQNASVFLKILESYKKNERFIYTPAEARMAFPEEKILDVNRLAKPEEKAVLDFGDLHKKLDERQRNNGNGKGSR